MINPPVLLVSGRSRAVPPGGALAAEPAAAAAGVLHRAPEAAAAAAGPRGRGGPGGRVRPGPGGPRRPRGGGGGVPVTRVVFQVAAATKRGGECRSFRTGFGFKSKS